MKCSRCGESKYIRISESKDRLLFRLFLGRCLRCHYCGDTFMAPVWKSFRPARTNSGRQVVARRREAMG